MNVHINYYLRDRSQSYKHYQLNNYEIHESVGENGEDYTIRLIHIKGNGYHEVEGWRKNQRISHTGK
jgi:hypothetical protein